MSCMCAEECFIFLCDLQSGFETVANSPETIATAQRMVELAISTCIVLNFSKIIKFSIRVLLPSPCRLLPPDCWGYQSLLQSMKVLLLRL